MNFHEHKRETFSVAWSPVTKDTFASSSWDGTVKIVRAAPRSASLGACMDVDALTSFALVVVAG